MLTCKIFFSYFCKKLLQTSTQFFHKKEKIALRLFENHNLIVNLDCGPLCTFYLNFYFSLPVMQDFFHKKIGKVSGWATVTRLFVLLRYNTGPKARPNTVLFRFIFFTQGGFPWKSKQMRWLLVQVGRYLYQYWSFFSFLGGGEAA